LANEVFVEPGRLPQLDSGEAVTTGAREEVRHRFPLAAGVRQILASGDPDGGEGRRSSLGVKLLGG